MSNILKQKKGITLIALVITIIVLLILAGISISMLSGDNGLLNKVESSKKITNEATVLEEVKLQLLGSYSDKNIWNYQDLKNNLNKLGINSLYDEEIYPIFFKYKGYDFKIDRYWNLNICNEVVYESDNLNFNGTSDYIDTGIKLFDKENFNKNFQIRIIVDEINKKIKNQGTLINAKQEIASLEYPGFVFRKSNNNIPIVELSMNGKTGLNTINYEYQDIEKKLITISRINGNIYCIINGELQWLYDCKDTQNFDIPLTIGCSLDSNGKPFRFFNGKISKIEVILTDDVVDIEEPQLIYAKLYSDGTLTFSSEDNVLSEKNLDTNYGIVYNRSYVKAISENAYASLIPWFEKKDKIKTVSFLDEIRPIRMNAWFANCVNLESFENMSNLNTSNVFDMNDVFYNCKKLNTLDLSNFDTRNVKYMEGLFVNCTNLKTIYVSDKFITSSATGKNMFKGCTSIVGGNETIYNPLNVDKTYAQIDTTSTPRIFYLKD